MGVDEKRCKPCGRTFPRTPEYFTKGKLAGGIGGYCRECHGKNKRKGWRKTKQYQERQEEKHAEKEDKPLYGKWHSNWVEVPEELVQSVMHRARMVVRKHGYDWCLEDVMSLCLVELRQGNYVDPYFVMVDLYRLLYGRPEGFKNQILFGNWEDLHDRIVADYNRAEGGEGGKGSSRIRRCSHGPLDQHG